MGERRYNSTIVNLGTGRAEWLASRDSRFTPGKEPLYPSGVRLRAGLDDVKKTNISCPIRNRTMVEQPVAIQNEPHYIVTYPGFS